MWDAPEEFNRLLEQSIQEWVSSRINPPLTSGDMEAKSRTTFPP